MTYNRIYQWSDLPSVPPDKAPETYALDFKAQHKKDPAEHAKDMAAFANAYGGVLLVGVSEKADNYERCLLPVGDAKQVAKDYEDAARDLLAPRPLIDPSVVLFPSDETRAIVAINVDAFAGQLVGARLPNTEGWRFPMRTTSRHTTYVDPEKAMIYADPRTRKAAILLSQVPAGEPLRVQARELIGTDRGRAVRIFEGELQSYERESNTVSFIVRVPDKVNNSVTIRAPLEDVEAVWRGEKVWAVRLSGCIQFPRASIGGMGRGLYLSGVAVGW